MDSGVDSCRVLAGVPAVDGGVVLHAGIAAVPGGVGNFVEQIFALKVCMGVPSLTALVLKAVVADYRVHEVIGDADGVVGVLEEDGAVGVGVGTKSRRIRLRSARGLWLLLSACTR